MNYSKRIDFINCIWLVFTLAFMLCFFAPLEFFFTQKEWFFFGADEILPFALLFTVCFLIGGSAVLFLVRLCGKKAYDFLFAIISGLTLTLYIQGNYIVGDYGALDGLEIDWAYYRTQGIISVVSFIGIWLVCIVLSYLIGHFKYQKIAKIVSICIFLIQLSTLAVLVISNGGIKRDLEYIPTTSGEYELSQDKNTIVLLLDSYDSTIFNEILQSDRGDEYRDYLDGFTYYPDTVGTFSFTDQAVPSILTGKLYSHEQTYQEYLIDSFNQSRLFKELEDNGWYCGLYTKEYLPLCDTSKNIDNAVYSKKTVSSHRRLAEYMYKLVGFRYLPQPLKKYCTFYCEDMKSDICDIEEDGYKIYDDDNAGFFDNIDQFEATDIGAKFAFYHLDGTHSPYNLDENMNKVFDRELTIQDEAKAMMLIIDRFLSRLKDEGTFDNSTIFIMADHGHEDIRQNPLLLIKGRGEEHPFVVSDTALSYIDMQDMLVNAMQDIPTERIVIEWPSAEVREFRSCTWSRNLEGQNYCKDIHLYYIDGLAYKPEDVIDTGNISYKPE